MFISFRLVSLCSAQKEKFALEVVFSFALFVFGFMCITFDASLSLLLGLMQHSSSKLLST